MLDTDDVLEALARALRQSSRLSDIATINERETDMGGSGAYQEFPLIEFLVLSEDRADVAFVGYIRDDDGNEIGEIYEKLVNLDVEITLWTISASDHDAVSLGDEIETTLDRYDADVYGEPLPDGDGGGIAEITLTAGEGRESNTSAPSGGSVYSRRWQQQVSLSYTQRVRTTDEFGELPFIQDVHYPRDGDYASYDPDHPDRIEAHPPYAQGFGEEWGLDWGQ